MTAPAPSTATPATDFAPLQLLALIIVVCTGFSSQMVMPLWIGAVIDQHSISESAAGFVASVEFAAVAITSMLIAATIPMLKTRPTAAFGVILLIVGNLLAAAADTTLVLTLARILTGCGKGVVVAIVFSLCAGSSNPTRTFDVMNISYALFATGFYLVMPTAIAWKGATGAFLVMAGVAIAGAVMFFKFPIQRLEAAAAIPKDWKAAIPMFGVLAMLALILMWMAHGFIWTFLERLGARAGLSVADIAKVLSFGAVITIAGPSIARIVDKRFGETLPVIFATVGLIVCAQAIIVLADPVGYTAATPIFQLLALFSTPYLMGILSAADPSGRLAALSSAAMTAGGSLGSLGGGLTVGAFGYSGLAWMSSAIFLAVIAIMLAIAPMVRTRTVTIATTISH